MAWHRPANSTHGAGVQNPASSGVCPVVAAGPGLAALVGAAIGRHLALPADTARPRLRVLLGWLHQFPRLGTCNRLAGTPREEGDELADDAAPE